MHIKWLKWKNDLKSFFLILLPLSYRGGAILNTQKTPMYKYFESLAKGPFTNDVNQEGLGGWGQPKLTRGDFKERKTG